MNTLVESRLHAGNYQVLRGYTVAIALASLVLLLLWQPTRSIVEVLQPVIDRSVIEIALDNEKASVTADKDDHSPRRMNVDVPPEQYGNRQRNRGSAASEYNLTEVAEVDTTTFGNSDTDEPIDSTAPVGDPNGVPDTGVVGTNVNNQRGNQPDGLPPGNAKVQPTDADEDFVFTDVDIAYSQSDLMANIIYPPMARELGIQGTVLLRVVVGESNDIVEMKIVRSDHTLLSNAAVRGVLKTRFTSAQVNRLPVKGVLFVPVSFTLH